LSCVCADFSRDGVSVESKSCSQTDAKWICAKIVPRRKVSLSATGVKKLLYRHRQGLIRNIIV
jgi:hypothetical protein